MPGLIRIKATVFLILIGEYPQALDQDIESGRTMLIRVDGTYILIAGLSWLTASAGTAIQEITYWHAVDQGR